VAIYIYDKKIRYEWGKDKLTAIIFCLGGGFLLRMINEYLGFPKSHILQDCLILSFVIISFWRQKPLAIILSGLTVILLGIIEYYSLPQWNNLLRAFLILALLIYLLIWCRCRKLNQL
jgi:uncharacterized membrane protein